MKCGRNLCSKRLIIYDCGTVAARISIEGGSFATSSQHWPTTGKPGAPHPRLGFYYRSVSLLTSAALSSPRAHESGCSSSRTSKNLVIEDTLRLPIFRRFPQLPSQV